MFFFGGGGQESCLNLTLNRNLFFGGKIMTYLL